MKNQVFIPTRKEFKQILSETIGSILDKRIPKIIRRANRKEYLTTAEFKELTGCSHRVQHYLRSKEKIPYSQEGRKIFYRTEDIEKFMQDHPQGRHIVRSISTSKHKPRTNTIMKNKQNSIPDTPLNRKINNISYWLIQLCKSIDQAKGKELKQVLRFTRWFFSDRLLDLAGKAEDKGESNT